MELLVVIAIIALLTSVALVAFGTARTRSRDAKRLADIASLANGLELYFNTYGAYPTTAQGLAALTTASPQIAATVPLPAAPVDNVAVCGGAYGGTVTSPTYVYTSSAPNTYSVTFCLAYDTGNFTGGTVLTLSPTGVK